jgi:hypothetical protein
VLELKAVVKLSKAAHDGPEVKLHNGGAGGPDMQRITCLSDIKFDERYPVAQEERLSIFGVYGFRETS